MAAPASVTVAVRTLVALFGCVGIFAFVYVLIVDRYSSCFEAHNRWLMALNVDFYINVAVVVVRKFIPTIRDLDVAIEPIGDVAWVIYKESNWIVAAAVTALLIVFGSVATSGYVITQFFKLSPEESSKDPFYFVLVRHQKRDAMGQRRGQSVVIARVIVSAVGCLMLGTSIYLLIVDGSPFHAKVFTPCMIGTLTDFYANIGILSVWIAYKETSWINAFFWILFLVLFGGVTTCVYIVRQLFYLSPQQPLSLIIFSSRNRDLLSIDPLLTAHGNV